MSREWYRQDENEEINEIAKRAFESVFIIGAHPTDYVRNMSPLDILLNETAENYLEEYNYSLTEAELERVTNFISKIRK